MGRFNLRPRNRKSSEWVYCSDKKQVVPLNNSKCNAEIIIFFHLIFNCNQTSLVSENRTNNWHSGGSSQCNHCSPIIWRQEHLYWYRLMTSTITESDNLPRLDSLMIVSFFANNPHLVFFVFRRLDVEYLRTFFSCPLDSQICVGPYPFSGILVRQRASI